MPFRFRKSFKIAPGLKINLSKGGISTSIGGRGHSINIGKRGLRSTIGIPGTGISYTNSSKSTPQDIQYPIQTQNTNETPSNVLAQQSVIENPENKPSFKLPIGCLFASGIIAILVFLGFIGAVITGSWVTPTSAPTIDIIAIQITANAQAWFPYTQTARAIQSIPPSATPTSTNIPLPTLAMLPLDTQIIYSSPTIAYFPPPQPTSAGMGHPSNTSGQCVDGSYTSAAHKQGACSHHGGVAKWWGP